MSKNAFMSYKTLLNLIFRYASRNGIIRDNPVAGIRNAIYLKSCQEDTKQPENRIFSPDEINALIAETKARSEKGYYIYDYMMRFAIQTGCRAAEICGLQWEDIHFSEGYIHIHRQQLCTLQDKHYSYYVVGYTKNERGISQDGRLFPLTEELTSLLQSLTSAQDALGINPTYVFCHDSGEWVTTKQYQNFLNKICKKLGLKATSNHTFRRSFNSNVLIQNGIAVTDRAKLLGHSPEVNLRNYSYASRDYLDNICNVLNCANKKEHFSDKKELFTPLQFSKEKQWEAL